MYSIFLDRVKIGTSKLENKDSSMGVAFGMIDLIDKEFNYSFIKSFCLENNIELTYDDFSEKLIGTRNIPNLKVFDSSKEEVVSKHGSNIEGTDNEGFQITILGISNSFFEKN